MSHWNLEYKHHSGRGCKERFVSLIENRNVKLNNSHKRTRIALISCGYNSYIDYRNPRRKMCIFTGYPAAQRNFDQNSRVAGFLGKQNRDRTYLSLDFNVSADFGVSAFYTGFKCAKKRYRPFSINFHITLSPKLKSIKWKIWLVWKISLIMAILCVNKKIFVD